jgi:hypothetical protein
MNASTTGSSAAPEDHPRLTPTQRLHEVTMAALARRPAAPESSVAISRNAKGVAQFEVTVRGEMIQDCYDAATDIAQRLEAQYPYPAVNGGTDG